jgi:hypothetical protein
MLTHPNQYFEESRRILKGKKPVAVASSLGAASAADGSVPVNEVRYRFQAVLRTFFCTFEFGSSSLESK